MTLSRISSDDPTLWSAFTAALAASNLPTEDLGAPDQHFFALDEAAAFGGYMRAGEEILVRSVVVPENARGNGTGTAISNALLEHAKASGAKRAWLLTNSASGFFEGLGFARVDRSDAPPAIVGTPQFSGVCPASAALLRKEL